jgi:hypothetical protein
MKQTGLGLFVVAALALLSRDGGKGAATTERRTARQQRPHRLGRAEWKRTRGINGWANTTNLEHRSRLPKQIHVGKLGLYVSQQPDLLAKPLLLHGQ